MDRAQVPCFGGDCLQIASQEFPHAQCMQNNEQEVAMELNVA